MYILAKQTRHVAVGRLPQKFVTPRPVVRRQQKNMCQMSYINHFTRDEPHRNGACTTTTAGGRSRDGKTYVRTTVERTEHESPERDGKTYPPPTSYFQNRARRYRSLRTRYNTLAVLPWWELRIQSRCIWGLLRHRIANFDDVSFCHMDRTKNTLPLPGVCANEGVTLTTHIWRWPCTSEHWRRQSAPNIVSVRPLQVTQISLPYFPLLLSSLPYSLPPRSGPLKSSYGVWQASARSGVCGKANSAFGAS